jgi:hypothetical protein
MRKITNTIYIIMLVFTSMTLCIEKSYFITDSNFDIRPFTKLQTSFENTLKNIHLFTDTFYNSILKKGKTEIPISDFEKELTEAFPFDEKSLKMVDDEILEFWLVKVDLQGSVDREKAYKALQNAITTAGFVNKYSSKKFKAGGKMKKKVAQFVNELTDIEVKLEKVTKELFNQSDISGRGSIIFNEFKKTFAQLLPKNADIEIEFNSIDEDKSKDLNEIEVENLLRKILLNGNKFFATNGNQNVFSHMKLIGPTTEKGSSRPGPSSPNKPKNIR